MAGTAPTDFHSIKTRYAGPVHCSEWLFATFGLVNAISDARL
jgi:hypothetical protein